MFQRMHQTEMKEKEKEEEEKFQDWSKQKALDEQRWKEQNERAELELKEKIRRKKEARIAAEKAKGNVDKEL